MIASKIFFSSLDSDTNIFGNAEILVAISSDGDITWSPPMVISNQCKVDITKFPFDTQNCTIEISSWMQPVHILNVSTTSSKVLMDGFIVNAEYEMIDTKAERLEYLQDGNVYTYVDFTLYIARRKTFFIIKVIIPVIILSFLHTSVFLLPPKSGEKMTFSVTVLLALTVFFDTISGLMPATSENISILG